MMGPIFLSRIFLASFTLARVSPFSPFSPSSHSSSISSYLEHAAPQAKVEGGGEDVDQRAPGDGAGQTKRSLDVGQRHAGSIAGGEDEKGFDVKQRRPSFPLHRLALHKAAVEESVEAHAAGEHEEGDGGTEADDLRKKERRREGEKVRR
jgi:hypothetical protein